MSSKPVPLEKRFWSKVDQRGPDECWPWLGSKNHKGYSRIHVNVDGHIWNRAASRVAWEFANGAEFPRDRLACHSCDNPGCVNPAHIWPGTPGDNMRDMSSKGRGRPGGFEQRTRAKFP